MSRIQVDLNLRVLCNLSCCRNRSIILHHRGMKTETQAGAKNYDMYPLHNLLLNYVCLSMAAQL